ncbi:MAG: DUF1501 domain-containing protein [Rhodobacteraceae bacterium]|nr:DUF1501 domain-containing protein [Paracoccaceae bacterium]
MSRRQLILRATALGCSAAASPLLTPVTMARAATDHRLVVIILRGGMDGLATIQPYGDPGFAGLRPEHGPAFGDHDLDGFFALNNNLGNLMPLWQAGELAFAHAVSTPYRDRRSHFDGQDLLEAGLGNDHAGRRHNDGWLNRFLQTLPGAARETALAVGRRHMLILKGQAPAMSWAPEARLALSPAAEALLAHIYHDDDLFREAFDQAQHLSAEIFGDQIGDEEDMMQAMADAMASTVRNERHNLTAFLGEQLQGDTRIVSFSLGGWDTHRNQTGGLRRALQQFSGTLLGLRRALGAVWRQTTVVAMTEFGRTARLNGSRGTDHGTGGAMIFAGGALRGGRVLGQWPGLGEGDLYADRDLAATGDVRAYAAWLLAGLYGTDRAVLEGEIFPGLDLGTNPNLT